MYKTVTLTEQLERIQKDIIEVLFVYNKPLSQSELHERSCLSLSELGWSFALEKLEKKGIVKFVGTQYWKLTNRSQHLKDLSLEEFGTILINQTEKLYPNEEVRRFWSDYRGLVVNGESIL